MDEEDEENKIDLEDYGEEKEEGEEILVDEFAHRERTSYSLFNLTRIQSQYRYDLTDIEQFKVRIISVSIENKEFSPEILRNYEAILEFLIDSIPYIKYKNPYGFLIGFFLRIGKDISVLKVDSYFKKYKDKGISKEDIVRYYRLIDKYISS